MAISGHEKSVLSLGRSSGPALLSDEGEQDRSARGISLQVEALVGVSSLKHPSIMQRGSKIT